MTDDVSCAASPPPLQKCCKGVFHSSPIVKETFFLEQCRQSLKSEVKRMTVTVRGKHSNPREDICVYCEAE